MVPSGLPPSTRPAIFVRARAPGEPFLNIQEESEIHLSLAAVATPTTSLRPSPAPGHGESIMKIVMAKAAADLVASGQHAQAAAGCRRETAVAPDHRLGRLDRSGPNRTGWRFFLYTSHDLGCKDHVLRLRPRDSNYGETMSSGVPRCPSTPAERKRRPEPDDSTSIRRPHPSSSTRSFMY